MVLKDQNICTFLRLNFLRRGPGLPIPSLVLLMELPQLPKDPERVEAIQGHDFLVPSLPG